MDNKTHREKDGNIKENLFSKKILDNLGEITYKCLKL